jgi:hypothetical protein
MLGQLVSMGALIGGTAEYVEILKRRARRRREVAEREESGIVGLQGLVRVLLTDGETQQSRRPNVQRARSAYLPE